MRTTTLPSMLEILTRNYNFRNKAATPLRAGPDLLRAGGRPGRRAQGADPGRLRRRHGLLHPQGRRGDRVWSSMRAEERHAMMAETSENPSYHPGRCAKVYVRRAACWALSARSIPCVAGQLRRGRRALLPPSCEFDALYASQGRQPRVRSPCPSSPPSPGTSPWCATRRSRWVRWRTASARAPRAC